MEDARARGNAIFHDYADALDKIYEEHVADVGVQTEAQIRTETEQLKREANKQLFQAQMDIKRELSQVEADLRAQLFSEVSGALERFMDTKEYEDFLIRRINRAKKYAGDQNLIVYIDPADSHRSRALEAATGVHLTMSQELFGGGIRAVLPDRRIPVSYTHLLYRKAGKTILLLNAHIYSGMGHRILLCILKQIL